MHDDSEVDRLYALDPSDFVRERDALAKALSKDDKAAGKQVKALRKPTRAAWALNTAARRDPDAVGALLSAGEELRRAQEGALASGDAQSLKEAGRRKRELVRRLADDAVALAGESHGDDIDATLEAATVDDAVGEELRRGRLAKAHPRPSGFGAVGELDWTPADTDDAADAADDGPDPAEDARRIAQLEDELARADAAVERGGEAVATAEQARREAERALTDAEQAVTEARATQQRRVDERDRIAAELDGVR